MIKGKIRLIILISIFAVVSAILTIIFWPFIKDLRNPEFREAFRLWVKGLGFKGVFILLGIQILQIAVPFIPGGPVQVLAGAAYGFFWGFVIIAFGCVLVSTLIFILIRKFGLPLLHRFFGEKDINAWLFLKDSRKVSRIIFILFLIPGTPKDLLTWLCPLANISLPLFVVLTTLARTPAILTSTIMGDSMIQGNWVLSLCIFLFIAIMGFCGMWFRDKITKKENPEENN